MNFTETNAYNGNEINGNNDSSEKKKIEKFQTESVIKDKKMNLEED